MDVMRDLVGGTEMTAFLSQRYRVPTVDLVAVEITEEVLTLVPRELCERHLVIPVSEVTGSLILAMTDPDDARALDAIAKATGMSVDPVIASVDEIRAALLRYDRY